MYDLNSISDRFWSKVNKTESCWLWTAGSGGNGYGKFFVIDPAVTRRKRMVWAHRVAWELVFGPIPEGMEILHNCPGGDNPRCVNPDHLLLGTHADNMRDAARKKQMAHGDTHPHAKLTEQAVLDLRSRPRRWGDQQRWAAEFGVGICTISEVLNRKRWR